MINNFIICKLIQIMVTKDLSYCIVSKGHKIPRKKDYANVVEYMEALNTHYNTHPFIYFHSFEMEGEDAPFVDNKMYTRDEIIKSLREWVPITLTLITLIGRRLKPSCRLLERSSQKWMIMI